MKIGFFVPPSPGSETSARILRAAIGPALLEHNGSVVDIQAPNGMPRTKLDESLAGIDLDCTIFMERVLDHPALMKARHRILVPNPEWLDGLTMRLAAKCTHVWHKSRYSLERLGALLPQAEHAYLGFTSEDPGQLVTSHERFVHLRGKLDTRRNTDAIFAAWKSAPSWPDLSVHFYLSREGGLAYPGWLHDGNVHVRMGWLDRPDYLALAADHGIHLCTSAVEGFGHYINEARAMGALVIAIDGAPMNELVDESSGILVRPSGTSRQKQGIRYAITAEDLAPAVERALSLTAEERAALGAAARDRYLNESQLFRERANALFEGLES